MLMWIFHYSFGYLLYFSTQTAKIPDKTSSGGMPFAIPKTLQRPIFGQVFGEQGARKPIVILDPDKKQSAELCSVLAKEEYRTLSFSTLPEFVDGLCECSPLALIINLDLVPMDNRALRELRNRIQAPCIIGLSSRTFHPELKEALSRYIDACFAQPVELDDLLYYLRGAENNAAEQRTEEVEPGEGF